MSKSESMSYKKHDQVVSDDSGNFTASVFTDGDGSHVTPSPRVDPTTSVQSTGLTEDGCYTSGVFMSEYVTAPSTPRKSPACESYLKSIFDNFNELYQDKMAWIDENISAGDNHQAKKNVLEHWVKDVIEQNNILVQTVEELEVEAEKKVQCLQKKVHEAAELAKEHMGLIKEYEEQIKQLMKEKHIVEKQEEFFRKESMYLEKEKKRALERLHTLENDNSSLVTLINRIRDMGVWDVNGLNFSPRTYDCIFGLYPNLAGSEVQTVFTREKARNLEKAETNIAQLTAQVEELHGRKTEAEKLLTEKTKVTEDLQNDIKDLHSKIKQYQDEHQEIKKSLKETQDQLKAATLKNVSRPSAADTKRESEMKEMLTELRDLRNQLNIACTERQQAMKESNSLKMELRGRITHMEDMKCLLDQIQTEAATTRVAVQDVQDKQDVMTSLKEKVNFFQTSYENSNLLLEAKSEIIEKLQDQMEQLHEKVSKLEKSSSYSPNPACNSFPPPPPLPATTTTVVSPSPTPSHTYNNNSHPTTRPSSRHAQVAQATGAIVLSGRKKIKDVIRKVAVKVKKPSVTPKSSKGDQKIHDSKRYGSSHKPPWNDHFVRTHHRTKPSSPTTTTTASEKVRVKVPSKNMSETKTTTISKVTPNVKSSDSNTQATRHERAEPANKLFTEAMKLHGLGAVTNESYSHQPVDRIIADYLGQSDNSSNKMSSVNGRNKKTLRQRIVERVKFPPIPTPKYESTNLITLPASTAKAYEKTLEKHLPRIIVKEKKIHTSSGIETLENLMEVCVKASRELNRQADLEAKTAPKYRVVTGHSHRRHNHRSRENTYTVEAVPKNRSSKVDSGLLSSKPTVYIARPEISVYKDKSVLKPGEHKQLTESQSDTMSDISQYRRVALHPPQKANTLTTPFPGDDKSPESILAELPKQSHDYLVKKWIVSSPSPSTKKIRKPSPDSPSKSTIHDNNTNDVMLAMDEWNGKQEMTQSDATGDRDSGHMSDFSDGWNWNVNDDETIDKDIQSNNSADLLSSVMESQQRMSLHHHEYDRIDELIAENQRLKEEKMELQQMNSTLKREKSRSDAAHTKEIELKDVEDCPFNHDDKMVHYNKSLTATQLALNSYHDKVGSYSRDLSTVKIRSDKLRSQSVSLDKDMLMYRSYVLLSKLEQDKELLMIGDCNQSLDSNCPKVDDKIVELTESWEKRLNEIKGRTLSLVADVTAKVADAESLKGESENMRMKMDELVKEAAAMTELMTVAKEEKSRLQSRIQELEHKQKDVEEMFLMESEFNELHSESDSCDTAALLLAEKRLGIIQKSYECLAHEVVHSETTMHHLYDKIEKLQNYIQEKECQSREGSSSRNDSGLTRIRQSQYTDTSDHLMSSSGDWRVNKPAENIENERVQKLIWLVTALRKKLKKKRDSDRKFQLDKEILLKTVSTMIITWEELQRCCENLRNENLYLKNKLEPFAICQSSPQSIPSSPCQITSSSDKEQMHQLSKDRIALNSTSDVPFLEEKGHLNTRNNNYANVQNGVDNSGTPNGGIDIMSRVLAVLEECVNNVSQLLRPVDRSIDSG